MTDLATHLVPTPATTFAVNPPTDQRDELTEAALRRVGQILKGKWRLDSLLGLGGTAAVYAATHRNGNRVAIKMLHAHISMDPAVTSRLQQEGYVANLVEHPGAVRILDDDRAEDGSVFLVMELLLGEGLDMRLRRKAWQLPEAEVVGIAFCLLEVLAAAHLKGVIHRDIKPDNVFITREGHIKVLDFGIARLLEIPEGGNRTRAGALFGTLGFMAPEQALGHTSEIDPSTDIWAVGATLFTLLTGRLVHEAVSPNEQLVKAATTVAPPLDAILPTVNPRLAAVIDRALAFDRADRWQSALEMQEAVRSLAEATSGPNAQPILQGPRLSLEMDLPGGDQVRAWPTPQLIRASARDLYPATMVVPRRARPWKTIAAVALAGSFAVGVMLERALSAGPSTAHVVQAGAATSVSLVKAAAAALLGGPEKPAVSAPVAPATTSLAVVAPSTTSDVGLPAVANATVPSVSETDPVAEIAVATDRAALRAAGKGNRHRGTQRFARGGRRAIPRSISDDDALWGRRY